MPGLILFLLLAQSVGFSGQWLSLRRPVQLNPSVLNQPNCSVITNQELVLLVWVAETHIIRKPTLGGARPKKVRD